MRRRKSGLRRLVRGLGALVLAATGAAAQAVCTFSAPPGITFAPDLDPSNATVRTAYTDVTITCAAPGAPTPSSWGFVGLYGTNPNLQMKHSTLADFIAYSIGDPPPQVSGGGGRTRTYRVTATILPASYQNAYAGTYSDSLTITVLP